jgi:L-threonylcarbamoyladenylate synthase
MRYETIVKTMSDAIEQAVNVLKGGGLVAFPTETVYGLGADATNVEAVKKIFTTKQRPLTQPVIVHLAQIDQLARWACHIPPAAERLAEHFWPGPLTIILPKHDSVPGIVTGGQPTIGLRIPRHPQALALLTAFGSGIAAPSANRFTELSPTRAQAVLEALPAGVDMVLDGGPCVVGLESTIVDLTKPGQAMILRPGMISSEQLSAVLGYTVRQLAAEQHQQPVPGSHAVHYAPKTKVKQLSLVQIKQLLQERPAQKTKIAILMHSMLDQQALPANVHIYTIGHSANEYAQQLYARLRQMDMLQYALILVEEVPNTPAWAAIQDRLHKASGRS